MSTRNTIKSSLILLLFSVSLHAQEFRVQVAAFIDEAPKDYFSNLGVGDVYLNTDQKGIHRYYHGEYSDILEANKAQLHLVNKGLANARVVDMKELRSLCGTPCPYMTKTTTYSSDSTDVIYLRSVFFGYNKSNLDLPSKSKLDELFTILKSNPSLSAHILGHSDSKGNARYNLKLSIRRARTARSYLISRGIAAKRLRTKAYGESDPIAINQFGDGRDSPQGRKFNRRVVIAILDNMGEIISDKPTEQGNVPSHLKFNEGRLLPFSMYARPKE